MLNTFSRFITIQEVVGMSIIKPTQEYYLLNSERLSFTPLTNKHISLWEIFFHNNQTEQFLGFKGSTKTALQKAEFWIERQIDREKNNEFGQLAFIEKESGQFIGLGGIIPREIEGKQEYEVSYSLLREAWGKGFGKEAATFFRDYMFNERNCDSVISIIHIENQASINVAEKNGMQISLETTFMDMPVFVYRAFPNKL